MSKKTRNHRKTGTNTGTPMGGSKFNTASRKKNNISYKKEQEKRWAARSGPVTITYILGKDPSIFKEFKP